MEFMAAKSPPITHRHRTIDKCAQRPTFLSHQLQVISIEIFIIFAGSAALQVVCSKFDTNDFQSNRTQFTVQLKEKLQERCDIFDCEINDVQVNDIRRPAAYDTAISEKQTAVENIQVTILSFSLHLLVHMQRAYILCIVDLLM